MTRILYIAAFLVGLAVIGWIGAGYVGSNPLALAVTALIGVTYLAGTWELRRYQQATNTLTRALGSLSEVPASLAGWLNQVHPTLRSPARLRIEGDRVALPGPALTPYLVGLLVLLGMLGTFLGMVATLRGTGGALESATDLQAIRASLAAPVKGLGFAFGTSVAGVATSAMLGLLSALCRRERIQAAQQLDVRIATTLRGHTAAHQRDETFRLLQRQAEAMPLLVDRLQTLMSGMEQRNQALSDQLVAGMAAMERQNATLGERLIAGQAALDQRLAAGQTALDQRLAAGQDALNIRLGEGQAALSERLGAGQDALNARLEAGQGALAARLGDGHEALSARLGASQEAFHDKAEAAYARLAASVGETLKESAAESARLAGAALQPVIEATMAGMASETAAWRDAVAQAAQRQHETITQAAQLQHDAVTQAVERQQETIAQAAQKQQDAVADAVQRQLDGLSARFETTTATVGELWNKALTQHQQANEVLAQDLRATLDRYAGTFEQRSAGLIEGVAGRLDTATAGMSQAWADALSRQQQANEQLTQANQQALAEAAAAFEQHSASVLEKIDGRSSSLLDKVDGLSSSLLERIDGQSSSMLAQIGGHSSSLLEKIEGHFSSVGGDLRQHSSSLLQNFEQHSAALLQAIEQSHAQRHAALEAREEQRQDALESRDQQRHAALEAREQQRLEAWTGALGAIAAELQAQWQATGTQTAARQQEICETLSRTAQDITGQAQAHARDTIAEIERLVQAASEAPKAAADVVAELRQKLSDSMVRDNAMLEERGRLLDTLGTLLDAVNRASTEQREAVDALVATSSDLLARVGGQFTDTLQAETVKLAEAAGQVTGSVVEVASMGDAFGAAVLAFGESNDKLTAHLQRIEGALEKSIARSDEQLAYYVAQAREIVDLSVMSQKQIIEDLQQLAEQRASVGSEAVRASAGSEAA